MKIKDKIEKTFKDFEEFFKVEFKQDLKSLDMALVRDRFKELIQKEHFIFSGSFDAEDSFLYVYHYRELQEIRRVANYLLETNQEKLYKKFIMEFFNDLSPSGLQELKVHQINNESDKIWFSKDASFDDVIASWRAERFYSYL